ncbi:MAG: carboxymuconolactone decarboxylase family protein [Phycisphaerales bacterium]
MSRLPIVSVESATGATKEMFDALQRALGMAPNMARVMANSPAVLRSWMQFNASLGGAGLPARIRERIALLSAEINGCSYCLSAHTALGTMAGLGADEIEGAREGKASDPKTQAALTFARRVIETGGGIDASDVERVREAGFGDGEIAEIVGGVALNSFTNIFNRAFDVDVDFPLVEARACSAC